MVQEITDKLNIQELLTNFVSGFLAYIPSIVVAIIIIVAAFVVSRAIRAVARAAFQRAGFEKVLTGLLIDNVLHYTIIVLGVLMGLSQLGVNVTAALAGVGVAGIAIGFAAQDSVANVISGVLIFWDKPFVVGDWIETEGQYGRVQDITLRTTRIRTPQNTYIIIPNKRIIDEVMENYSKDGEMRVDVLVGIAYKEDISKAREVLLEAVTSVKEILEDPGPDVVVDALADSSVNLKLRAWVSTADNRRKAYFNMTEIAKNALDEAGIEIPFPHLQLFVDTVEERVWDQAQGLAKTTLKAS